MFSKNHPIILFLDRDGFSVFQDTLPNIAKFNFTPEIVTNLDVINKEHFSNLISTFIQINKILPSSLALVLSDNIIYEKDLENALQNPTVSIEPLDLKVQENIDKEHKEEIQNFLEDVPFEEVLAKVIKADKPHIVAVNKDLIMTIADVFANKGSTIEAIIPSFMYGSSVNFAAGLTQNNIQAILGESEILRTGNLLTDQQKINSLADLETEQKEKEKNPKNLRQYLLVGVFVTFLVILAVVYLNLGASKTLPQSKKIKGPIDNAVIVPTTVPTFTRTQISPTSIDLKSVEIKIVQNSESEAIGNNLKNELLKIGFENITSETSGDTTAEKSSVLFSKTVPADVRDRAFTEIKKILPDVGILESQDINSIITIILGKS